MTKDHPAKKVGTVQHTTKSNPPRQGGADTPPRHWIIVADHRQAHVYQKTRKGIERIPEESLHCALPVPGGEQADDLFLRDLAAWLQVAADEEAFDRIALIADPQALKSIHPMLDKRVHARICAALAKDIEKITEDEIEDHLAEVVWL